MSSSGRIEKVNTTPLELNFWEPIIFRSDTIQAEIDRLAGARTPPAERQVQFVHPRSVEPGLGLAPGIRVTLSVLLPGEATEPVRHNATEVNFCIQGRGTSQVGHKEIPFNLYDVWTTPSFEPHCHVNDGSDIQVRLTYSNAPLLEKLNVYLLEDAPVVADEEAPSTEVKDEPERSSPFGSFYLEDGQAMLMPYETLVNPETVPSLALHWPWSEVHGHLDELVGLGKSYVGRRLYLMYNPSTGRTNGTTRSFFATMTIRPPNIVDRPHRHVSAAINYFFRGHGWSRIGGRKYEWNAGDLMLTAPGWMVHNHASGDESVYELTVQDQPFHIAGESLLWQEDLKHPARLLGYESGFVTNRVS
jgi:gentisate 1,2-dioxygenase